jgi:serine/threonine protein kinase
MGQPGDVSRSLTAGSRVAAYRVEEQIGVGARSVVYRAIDERLGRQVALKIVAPALAADSAFRQRLVREWRAVAAVDHPNIIPLYEAGEDGGLLFLAMKYVPGKDAGTLVELEGPLTPGRAAAFISAIASALDSLHAAGLSHRDVRPANILVDSRPSPPDHPYLTGFGLRETALSSRGLSMTGQIGDSVAYMAPELIEGKALDERADEYSLACTAFELLTGAPPFARDQVMALLLAHVTEPPPLLTSRRASLRPAADYVLAKALAKAPADRFPSSGEFASSLRRALGFGYDGATPVSVLPASPRQPPRPVAPAPDVREAPAQTAGQEIPTGTIASPAADTAAYGFHQPQFQPAGTAETAASDRFLVAHLPTSVPLRSDVSLIVKISAAESGGPEVRSAALSGLVVGAGGANVTVVVQAPHDLVPIGVLEQVIWVPESGDSEPVRFAFHARGEGLQRVVVTAWAGGTFLCELALELSVQDGATFVDAPDRRAPVGAVRAEPGEVTLQVRFDGQRYIFQLLSGSALFEPVLAEILTAEPGHAVERTIDTLRKMAAGSSGYTSANTRRWMTEAGIGLWNEMVPDLIKEQFWQLRDDIRSFSIAAGRDIVPWELLYPLSPGRDEGFLVEQFPVLRRVYGQQSASITLTGAQYVMPAGSPANALDEIAVVKRILAETHSGAEYIDDLAVLMGLIDSGDTGLLHFACHNTFRSDAGGSAIAMGGGPFVPALLNRAVTLRTLASRHPLVFINACRSAGAVPEYTQMMGWAQQFMAAGAGAFVGTLWAVRSDNASRFAAAFYNALAAEAPLGAAAKYARVHTARDSTDPTWLAYTIYGDPAARARTS